MFQRKLKSIFAVILLILISSGWQLYSQNLQFEWAASFGGLNNDAVTSVVTDQDGNIYSTGYFYGTADFDPGPAISSLSSNGWSTDVFITKLDINKNLVWAKNLGGSNEDYGFNIAIDPNGFLYIGGMFHSNADFDPGPSTYNLTSNGSSDIFICKLDTSGSFIWAKSIGGTTPDELNSIAVDNAGNLVATGSFQSTVDFDPGTPVVNLYCSGVRDIFVFKLNSSGNLQWAHRSGNFEDDEGLAITTDLVGNIYVSGRFFSTVDFDPGSSVANLASGGWYDAFIVKYLPTGAFSWAKSFGNVGWEKGTAVAIDSSFNVYLAGHFYGTVDFDPGAGLLNLSSNGSNDVFLLKLDANADLLWAKSFGGNLEESVSAIALSSQNEVFLSGDFMLSLDFDPGITNAVLTSNGGKDPFISSFTSSGEFIWAKSFGGAIDDIASSVITLTNGELLIGGSFQITVDFNPAGGINSYSALGGTDCFLMKLAECFETDDSVSVFACQSYLSPSGNYIWNSSGSYIDTINSFMGCDSILTIDLTITTPADTTITEESCGYYTSPSGNYLWTTTGLYTDTIENIGGCDSIIHINLIVHHISNVYVEELACGSYTSPSGNYVWSTSGTYADTVPNIAGCDSIITINLSVGENSEITLFETVCDGYPSPDGSTVWNTSGVYIDSIPNSTGCDSIITVYLTVLGTSSSQFNETSCVSFEFNNTIYTSSGIYYDTLVNSIGCDSIITLNLSIDEVDTTVTIVGETIISNASSATYQWFDCFLGENIENAVLPSITLMEGNSFALIVTQNDCSDTTQCYSLDDIGIHNPRSYMPFKLYPNPANDFIKLELRNSNLSGKVEIFSSYGQILKYKHFRNTDHIILEINSLDNGYYLVLITLKDEAPKVMQLIINR